MKRALLLHGTDGSPDYNWFPWLKAELERRGCTVWAPLLPENHTPNSEKYIEFLKNSDWDFTDNIIIGHSSGATAALHLLQADWMPRVKQLILVGLFLNERLMPSVDWYELGQFDGLFPRDEFNANVIKQKTESIVCIHGDDDPYCALDDTQEFAANVNAKLLVIPEGKHLSSNRKTLPEILPYVEL